MSVAAKIIGVTFVNGQLKLNLEEIGSKNNPDYQVSHDDYFYVNADSKDMRSMSELVGYEIWGDSLEVYLGNEKLGLRTDKHNVQLVNNWREVVLNHSEDKVKAQQEADEAQIQEWAKKQQITKTQVMLTLTAMRKIISSIGWRNLSAILILLATEQSKALKNKKSTANTLQASGLSTLVTMLKTMQGIFGDCGHFTYPKELFKSDQKKGTESNESTDPEQPA